ncbi:hypothetical protein L9F63_026319, partial [Diploptera punctata]
PEPQLITQPKLLLTHPRVRIRPRSANADIHKNEDSRFLWNQRKQTEYQFPQSIIPNK